MTRIAHQKGLITSKEAHSLAPDELDKLTPHGAFQWGTNSRGKAIRGRTLLGWMPHRRSLVDELPDIVEGEARALGLIEGHAAKATQ